MPYLIYCNEGGPRVKHFERDRLQEILEYCGLNSYTPMQVPPTENDPNYWGERYLIIDGELAVPKEVTRVTQLVMPEKR